VKSSGKVFNKKN